MSDFNLPPGVTVDMIPGCGPDRDLDYEQWADELDAATPPPTPETMPGPQHCIHCKALATDDNHVEAESETCEACKWEYGCEFVPLRGEKPQREYDQPTECLTCGRGPITPQGDGFCSDYCFRNFCPF